MLIKKIFLCVAMSSVTLCASAGQYATELGQCLYNNASQADSDTLTQWAFVTLSQTRAAKSIATIPAKVNQEVTSKAQTVVLRLLAKDCASQALKATLYEGKNGVSEGIKHAVTMRLEKEFQSQTVDALIAKLTQLKTP
jgi:hypothetical protein